MEMDEFAEFGRMADNAVTESFLDLKRCLTTDALFERHMGYMYASRWTVAGIAEDHSFPISVN
jgi:hypothetical protein